MYQTGWKFIQITLADDNQTRSNVQHYCCYDFADRVQCTAELYLSAFVIWSLFSLQDTLWPTLISKTTKVRLFPIHLFHTLCSYNVSRTAPERWDVQVIIFTIDFKELLMIDSGYSLTCELRQIGKWWPINQIIIRSYNYQNVTQ